MFEYNIEFGELSYLFFLSTTNFIYLEYLFEMAQLLKMSMLNPVNPLMDT